MRDLCFLCVRACHLAPARELTRPPLPLGFLPPVLLPAGVTSDGTDAPVDFLRDIVVPIMRTFGVPDAADIKIERRAAAPEGGGTVRVVVRAPPLPGGVSCGGRVQVRFHCPTTRQLRPVQLVDAGLVKRIRGTAFTMRVSPQVRASARGTRVRGFTPRAASPGEQPDRRVRARAL